MILDSIDKFKPLIGEKIFAMPTGNNARYKDKDYIEEFTVDSVGRKYVKLTGLYSGTNYCPKSGATQSEINAGYGCNAGYRFFKTKIDIESYYEKSKLAKSVSSKSSYFNFQSLTTEQLKVIAEMLGVEQL